MTFFRPDSAQSAASSFARDDLKGLIATLDAAAIDRATHTQAPYVVILASLALGGAERIVVDWMASVATQRSIKLVVLHDQSREFTVHPSVNVVRFGGVRLVEQLEAIVEHLSLRGARRVLTHLVRDDLLAVLWDRGVETIPVFHNTAEGWRNDPRVLAQGKVPYVIAVADVVADQVRAAGFPRPVLTMRHQVRPALRAVDPGARETLRARWGCMHDTLVIGMIGAFKAQKAYPRAIRVLREVLHDRDARLVIAGAALGDEGIAAAQATRAQAERLGLFDRVIPLGAVDPLGPTLSAFDVVLNTSTHEGLSVATLEALAAHLPVVATRVGGQAEIDDPSLRLIDAPFDATRFARELIDTTRARMAQTARGARPHIATNRLWSLAQAMPLPSDQPGTTATTASNGKFLFITANLNAGGAQRSLVNLCCAMSGRRELAVAVVDASTHPYFAGRLTERKVPLFRPADSTDPFAAAEGLLQWIAAERPDVVCFWNVDPKLKLVLAKMLLPGVCKLVDVSPGHYSFLELDDTVTFQRAIAFDRAAYAKRLDATVLKYAAPDRASGTHVIANGVETPTIVKRDYTVGPTAKILVSGRIAPSKRLERIFAAMVTLKTIRPSIELHVYGQAEPRHRDYLESLVERWRDKLGTALVLHGARPDALDTLPGFDAIVVLGEHQGSPNTVLEALATGLPVIANASGGTAELLQHGNAGTLLSTEADPAEISMALAAILDDRARAERLAREGRRWTVERFGMQRMTERYEALFDALMDNVANE
jgi:glycosyltransferase involved in cell wall biosynthesis